MRSLRHLFRTEPTRLAVAQPLHTITVQSETTQQRKELLATRQRLAEIFSPARPLSGNRIHMEAGLRGSTFVGREVERERIMRALLEDRSHVVIYGERGRGKTSLANLVLAQARAADCDVARYICSVGSDFDAIMRGLFDDMARLPSATIAGGLGARRSPVSVFPPHPLRPADIFAASGLMLGVRAVFIVDEFDRVLDVGTRAAIADTIKQCSDRSAAFSFMIIGVSDSAEELLGQHPSIQRCVSRIAVPLLTHAEAEQLVARGAARAGLDFPDHARASIAGLSRGVPYMVQLLALRTGQAALDNGRTAIRGSDLLTAIKAAVAEADPQLADLYNTITKSGHDAAALGVLRAAAAGQQDRLGRFTAEPDGSFVRVAGILVDAAAWRRMQKAGAIRAVHTDGRQLYTFGEAMLAQLVLQLAVLAQIQKFCCNFAVPD